MIPTGATRLHNLDDSILLAETAGLGPARRGTYLSAPLDHDGAGSAHSSACPPAAS